MRYRIETVFCQLTERFHVKRIWARDLWHLTSRWIRKFLSHTLAAYFCFLEGVSFLSFAKFLLIVNHTLHDGQFDRIDKMG